MAGIYIHIPFCKQACHYCDFHFSTNTTQTESMLTCLQKEIEIQKDYLTNPVETIYFGGGTPSLLTSQNIQSILSTINKFNEVIDEPEVTLEANPDDLNPAYLNSIAKVGVNRLSIGIQSFNNEVLKYLNRAHDNRQAEECMTYARKAGFKNISVDLIYGIPDRNDKLWKDDILKLVQFNPEHISAYCLTIEPKTAFGNWVSKGKMNMPEEEHGARQFEILIETLEKEGYEQYEISNFCRPGFYSKHNTSYWKQIPYLGIGPSAHSFNLTSRQNNVSNNIKYIKALEANQLDYQLEELSIEDAINEYLLTALRTKWGVDLSKFGLNNRIDKAYLDKMVKLKKVVIENDWLYLTKEGKLLADQISSDLFITN